MPHSSSKEEEEELPGVSILRPLSGVDHNLYANLESCLQLQYPKHKIEVLFCISSKDDAAVSVVKTLLERHPGSNARIVFSEKNICLNPKVSNLLPAYDQAKNPLIWILDSNVLIHPLSLLKSVRYLPSPHSSRPKHAIGLVHHLPYGLHASGIGGKLDATFLNTAHAKMYLAINWYRIDSCLNGKSNMFWKSDLQTVLGEGKGLETFGDFLGEDHMIGHGLWHRHPLKLRHQLIDGIAALNVVGEMGVREYWNRRLRWIRARKYMVTASTLVEPFTESLVAGLCLLLSLSSIFPGSFSASQLIFVFFLHLTGWYMIDKSMFGTLSRLEEERGTPKRNQARLEWHIWMMRELLAFPIWSVGWFGGNGVQWRDGEELTVGWGGRVSRRNSRSSGVR
ncbi:glycosyltransferase family 21 protein [Atractiella rhizophila]|nr:glycosyltransferase family 21 protein [Atractiella rhizophila]KAH8928375.1 glycosyltransferase family 21 protein [Atractiella rhizophila]